MVRVKADVDLNELRKFGFKLGKEWADAGERCLSDTGYQYQHEWWHKFLMEPGEERVCYVSDEFDIPVVQIVVKPEFRDICVECAVDSTYHVGGNSLDMLMETIFDLTEAAMLEAM